MRLNTLGEMLSRRYVTDFFTQMKSLGPLGMWTPPRASRLQVSTNNLEYVATVLFRENKMDKWAIWKLSEEEPDAEIFESVLGHQCRRFGSVSLMSISPNEDEVCYMCDDPMPENLIGLWKMQNYDNYTGVLNDK